MLTICIILIVLLALDLLFTLALRCRKGHRKWEVLKKYRYAHRGYHDKPVIPENSLPAFRRAIERGFGAELDVHLLKDGTLAVFHDSDLRRCANVEGEIEDLTLDELKQLRLEGTDEQIPTFDEVLALFEHATPLIIELKTARGNHKALAKAVCERLDSYQGEFCIESFDPFALIDVKKFRPAICRGQLSMNFEKDKSGLPWYKRFIAGNLLPLRAVSALSVALYGMFLAIIIPPARKSRVVAALVAISFALSFVCNYLPGISALSEGTRTILLTVLISSAAAVLFPVNPDEQEAEHDA